MGAHTGRCFRARRRLRKQQRAALKVHQAATRSRMSPVYAAKLQARREQVLALVPLGDGMYQSVVLPPEPVLALPNLAAGSLWSGIFGQAQALRSAQSMAKKLKEQFKAQRQQRHQSR